MRKIIVLEHLSLDGVIQAPGGKDEDLSGGFTHGGWTAPFASTELGRLVRGQMHREFDLLLGRRTYELWADYWPNHAEIWPEANAATKYVASTTQRDSLWGPDVFLSEPVEELKELKQADGPDFHVWGSSELVQTLLHHDLVDECWFIHYPIIIGSGKQLFPNDGMNPLTLEVIEHHSLPNGVSVVHYKRNNDVEGA